MVGVLSRWIQSRYERLSGGVIKGDSPESEGGLKQDQGPRDLRAINAGSGWMANTHEVDHRPSLGSLHG
jgi:hypothetical protein